MEKVKRRLRIKEAREAYLMILPFLILMGIFSLFPVFQGILLSFYKVGLPEDKYIGLRNYQRVLTDDVLMLVLKNTFLYGIITMLGILLCMPLGLLINSTFMENKPRLRWVLQAVILLPMVISWVTLGSTWNWIFLVGAGEIAKTGRPGAIQVSPLARSDTALPTVGLLVVWGSLGYNAILFLTGLRSIPKVMYEAAQIDGASNWQTFRYVTLPLLRPILVFMLVTSFIGAFQIFDPVATLTSGGPGWYSASVAFYAVRQAWYALDYGYAAVIGLIVVAIVFTLSVVQFRLIYKRYI
jgi:multiple sugar transport system permease protein